MVTLIVLSSLLLSVVAFWVATTKYDELREHHAMLARRVSVLEKDHDALLNHCCRATQTTTTAALAAEKPARKTRKPRK